eukprot:234439_1
MTVKTNKTNKIQHIISYHMLLEFINVLLSIIKSKYDMIPAMDRIKSKYDMIQHIISLSSQLITTEPSTTEPFTIKSFTNKPFTTKPF